jgi:hypothetical protein
MGYVVTACFPKILKRLDHKLVSVPYYNSLLAVKPFQIEEVLSHGPISESQRTSDEFLLTLIPHLNFPAHLPELIKQATLASDNKPFALYTKDTCWEFHTLLIKLLESYNDAIHGLWKNRPDNNKEGGNFDEFRKHLDNAIASGYALMQMVHGSGISEHLKILAPSLPNHQRQEHADSTTMTDEQAEDQDLDLLHIGVGITGKDGRPQSVWKSYLDWLTLILAQFKAVEILVEFTRNLKLRGPYRISIKILTSPNIGKQKLPWKKVLGNSNFFPSDERMINDDIIKSLTQGISSHPELMVNDLKNFLATFNDFTTNENSSPDCLSPFVEGFERFLVQDRWQKDIEQIFTGIKTLQQNRNDSDAISSINEAASSLRDDANIFKLFRDTDGQPFSGTVHCEAILASLFLRPSDVLPQIEVIYNAFIPSTVRY